MTLVEISQKILTLVKHIAVDSDICRISLKFMTLVKISQKILVEISQCIDSDISRKTADNADTGRNIADNSDIS